MNKHLGRKGSGLAKMGSNVRERESKNIAQ